MVFFERFYIPEMLPQNTIKDIVEHLNDNTNEHRIQLSEPHLFDILFLEYCLNNNIIPKNLEKFSKSESIKVRKLSLLIIQKYTTFSINSFFSINDPSSDIRAIILKECTDISILKLYVYDRNENVRLAVLEAFNKIDLDEETQNDVLSYLLHLINDTSFSVKLNFCKILKKFTKINSLIILRLLDKEKEGTFIFGIEDESVLIRKNVLDSLEYFIREDTKLFVLNFVISLINDDSIKIRIKSIKIIKKITKNFRIKLDCNNLYWLVLSNKEQNIIIRKYLVKILSNIHFDNILEIKDFFKENIFKNFENRNILKILNKIIDRNKQIFIEEKEMFIFSNKNNRNNYEIEYLCDLLILNNKLILGKCNYLENGLNDNILINIVTNDNRNDLTNNGTNGTLTNVDNTLSSTQLDKKILKDMNVFKTVLKRPEENKINEYKTIYKIFENENIEIIIEQLNNTRTITSFGRFIKNYFLLEKNIKNILLVPFKFKFNRKKFNKLILASQLDFTDNFDNNFKSDNNNIDSNINSNNINDNTLTNINSNINSNDFSSNNLKVLIRKILKMAIKRTKYGDVRECNFLVKLSQENTFNYDFPSEFWIEISSNKFYKEMRFVIESENTKLLFEVDKSGKMKIMIDVSKVVKCYLGVLIKGEILRLTTETEVYIS